MPPDLFSLAQVAVLLGCSRQRVHILVQEGKLRAHRVGRMYCVAPADLVALLAARS